MCNCLEEKIKEMEEATGFEDITPPIDFFQGNYTFRFSGRSLSMGCKKARYIIWHSNYGDVLTLGKIYDIHEEKEYWILIHDDRGNYQYYRKNCFKVIGDKNMKENNKLRHDDPVYYKCAIRELITEAQGNGLKLQGIAGNGNIQILFKSGNGECAGVAIPVEI